MQSNNGVHVNGGTRVKSPAGGAQLVPRRLVAGGEGLMTGSTTLARPGGEYARGTRTVGLNGVLAQVHEVVMMLQLRNVGTTVRP